MGIFRAESHRRAIVHHAPDFLDFLIRDGDATIGPVASPMRRADPPISVVQTVNEYIPAWRNTEFACALAVSSIRIGDVQGAVELAMCAPAVDRVSALWCLVVPLARLRPDRLSSQSDFVSL